MKLTPMAAGNLTIPDDLLPKLQEAATADNRTAGDVAAEAIRNHLARRALECLKRERVPTSMSDEEVLNYVDRVIHEFRAAQREL